jgi:tRNA G10  N-methylase Trm11
MTVAQTTAGRLLSHFDEGSVHAIITSPPFTGLPGRGDTLELVEEMLAAAGRALDPERGTVTMIVGPSPGHPLLPFHVADMIEYATDGAIALHSMYVWDRTGTLSRPVGDQNITHDQIIHAAHADAHTRPLHGSSVIRTSMHGFNYGAGVTTPPDLAALLVQQASAVGDLVVDPFAGLGEIGVQAVNQNRRFAGSDISDACVTIANERLRGILPVEA